MPAELNTSTVSRETQIWRVPDTIRCVRGCHLDQPANRVDFAFTNGWGAIVRWLHGQWRLCPVHYDPVDDRFNWIDMVFPSKIDDMCGDEAVIQRALLIIEHWPTAPQPPDWPAEIGTIYLIANLGFFGDQIVAKSSYHGYLGTRNHVFAQKVSDIPPGISAEQVMIARNNAITEGKLNVVKWLQISWATIAGFLTDKELGLARRPACAAFFSGPGFVDMTQPITPEP